MKKLLTVLFALVMMLSTNHPAKAFTAETFLLMSCSQHFDPAWAKADTCNSSASNPQTFNTAEACEKMADDYNKVAPVTKTQKIMSRCFRVNVPVTVFEPTR